MLKPIATQLSTFQITQSGVPCTAISITSLSFSTKLFINLSPIMISPGTVTIVGLISVEGYVQIPAIIISANIQASSTKLYNNFFGVIKEGDYGTFIMPPGSMINPGGTPNPNPIEFKVEVLNAGQTKVYLD